MGTLFPVMDELQNVPLFHTRYAETILKIIISRLLSLEEIDVGIFQDRKIGSIISISDGEFDSVVADLKFSGEFELVVHDNSENNDSSSFSYTLSPNKGLMSIIPLGLQEFMEVVALEQQPAVLRPRTLSL
jgi:hypothetical protein